MRKIEKRAEPRELTQWRAANQADPSGTGINFGYNSLRQSASVIKSLMDSLLNEQGFLCAYTGRRIERDSAHVEHLVPQAHCQRGQDVAYNNVVACWPHPKEPRGQFGAHPKEDWPSPADAPLFVSPLSTGCEARFQFNEQGEIRVENSDEAAAETVKRLKLDHRLLTALRRAEIDSVLGNPRNLSLKSARSRLRGIEDAEARVNRAGNLALDAYCFVLKQVLKKYIRSLEKIGKNQPSK